MFSVYILIISFIVSHMSAPVTTVSRAEAISTTFKVIVTLDNRGCQFIEIRTSKPIDNLSEENIVAAVLSTLDDMEAKSLVKISLWSDDPTPSWLIPRNGKFLFNPDVNSDADTVAWAKYRDEYVERREKNRSI